MDFEQYLREANTKPDYNTNAGSYYKDLARKQELIKLLAKKIWDYEQILDETLDNLSLRLESYINENDSLMTERLKNWDERIENLDEEVSHIFIEWLEDGTLEQIINHDVLGNKADKSYVDELHENVTTHLTHIKNQRIYVDAQEGDNDYERITNSLNTIRTNGGGVLVLTPNTIYTIDGLIKLPSNIIIEGNGAEICLPENKVSSLLINDWENGNENITIKDLIVNGRYNGMDDPSIQLENHLIFLKNVKKLNLDNIEVKNPVAWCTNINTCEDVSVNNFRAYSVGAQMDGLHFVDTIKVRVNNVYGLTGDDVIGITVDKLNMISDYVVSNVQGSSVIGSLIRLNQTDTSVTGQISKIIKDMTFSNLNGWDCGSRGFNLYNALVSSTIVENIKIDGIFRNIAREAIRIVKGKNLEINVNIKNSGKEYEVPSIRIDNIEESTVKVNIEDVADGVSGLLVNYARNTVFSGLINYVKLNKTNEQPCSRFERVEYCTITDLITWYGLRGIQLGTSSFNAAYNIVNHCIIRETVGSGIEEGTSSGTNRNIISDNLMVNTGQGIVTKGLETVDINNTRFVRETI